MDVLPPQRPSSATASFLFILACPLMHIFGHDSVTAQMAVARPSRSSRLGRYRRVRLRANQTTGAASKSVDQSGHPPLKPPEHHHGNHRTQGCRHDPRLLRELGQQGAQARSWCARRAVDPARGAASVTWRPDGPEDA
ncbi:DUF2933 domain-containing protein [Pseudomonas aeruginosa]